MTLADVDPSYPVDEVVQYFYNSKNYDFGHVLLDHFYIDYDLFYSND